MSDTELAAAYRATEWTLTLPDARQLRLRLPPAAPPPDPALRGVAIITAYNPASDPQTSAAANRAADVRLRARLSAPLTRAPHRLRVFPALASGNGADAARWDEPGYAVAGIDRCDAVALGAEFGQNAIVWIDAAGAASLVVTRDGFCGRQSGETLHPPPVASL